MSNKVIIMRMSNSLIADLAAASRILAAHGVVDGFGHVSFRHPEAPGRYLMARSVAPALVTPDDIIEYDLDSNPVNANGRSSFLERFIHGEIYKARPDIQSIVHSHSPSVIPFGLVAVPLEAMFHTAAFIAAGVPVFDIRRAAGITDMLISTPALGRALAQTLGSSSAALMRGHGAVVAAASVRLVVAQAYYLNVNARLQMQAMAIGGGRVNYLDPQEARKAAQTYERSWDAWRARLPRR